MGFEPETLWRMTPRMLSAIIEGYKRRQANEHDQRAWLAWHIAALRRVKKLPKLKALLSRRPKKLDKPRDWRELEAIAFAWDQAINRR